VRHSFKINRNCHQFFSVVNCEYCSCCCSAVEQCIFSCMCRESSKCHGMVTCALNSGIIFSFYDGEGLFPTNYTFQILLPQIYISLELSRMPSLGKGLRLMTRLLKNWLQVQNSNWCKKETHALVCHWCEPVQCDGNGVEKWGL